MKALTNFLAIFFGLFAIDFVIALTFGTLIHIIYRPFDMMDALLIALGTGLGSAVLIIIIYYVIIRK